MKHLIARLCAVGAFLVVHHGCFGERNVPILTFVESSPFQMILSPVSSELNSEQASKLEEAIGTSLQSSTLLTSTLNPTSVFDVDVVLLHMEWRKEVEDDKNENSSSSTDGPSIAVRFIAFATFFESDDESSGPSSNPPSRFALDSAVVQTYSQISSKSEFIALLHRLGFPLLEKIDEIIIEPASSEDFNYYSDHEKNGVSSKTSQNLSIFEIFLIFASLFIVSGMIYMIYQYHKDNSPIGNQNFLSLNAWTDSDRPHEEDKVNVTCGDNFNDDSPTIIIKNDSHYLEKIVDEKTKTRETEAPFETHSVASTEYPECPHTERAPSPQDSMLDIDEEEKPTSTSLSDKASIYHAWSETSSNQSSSLFTTNEATSISTSDRSSGSGSSRISPRILLCPSIEGSAFSRIDSPILLSLSIVHDDDGDDDVEITPAPTVDSVVAVNYHNSSSSSDVVDADSLSDSSSNWTTFYATPDMKAFGANWIEFRKATYEEDDNRDDVFRVEMAPMSATSSSVPTNAEHQSISSATSSISEWMKSIRVVHSSSETGASTITISSAEHSGVDSFSSKTETSSEAHSLEKSLADSGVEI